ncbi:MAG: family 16 glycoside hydrolase [Verrucomicrobiota bacterium]
MLSRVLGLLAALVVSAPAADLVFNWGNSASDHLPPGFTNIVAGKGEPGVWKIVMDEMPTALAPLTDKAPAVSRRAALAQTSMDVADEHFPMLVYSKETFDDFTLTTKFKLVEGVSEQMAGLVFRLQDENNFYVMRASGLGNNVRFYKMVQGIRSQPIGPVVPLARRTWHELKIECRGNKITGWLNGELVIPELMDTSFRSGRIGFWTKSDSVSYFTDTKITFTPRESPAQILVRDTMAKNPRLLGLKIYLLDEIASHVWWRAGREGSGRGWRQSGEDGHLGRQGFYGKGKDTVSSRATVARSQR